MRVECDEFLMVTAGTDDYGIPVQQVRRIARGLRIVRVPGGDPATVGVVHIGGQLIAAFDLNAILHGTPDGSAQVHVVVDVGGETVDLLVNEVGTLRRTASRTPTTEHLEANGPLVLNVASVLRDARTALESA